MPSCTWLLLCQPFLLTEHSPADRGGIPIHSSGDLQPTKLCRWHSPSTPLSMTDSICPVQHCSTAEDSTQGSSQPGTGVLCQAVRLSGAQQHSGHGTKSEKSHHSLPSNSMSFQAS